MNKPLRGAITNATLAINSSIYGILNSVDLCAGQVNRNELTKGGAITTSTVIRITVEGGALTAYTLNSKYIIDGDLAVCDEPKPIVTLKSVGG